jgi:hypothetical protein
MTIREPIFKINTEIIETYYSKTLPGEKISRLLNVSIGPIETKKSSQNCKPL